MRKEDAMLLVIDFQETLFEKCIRREAVERNAVKLIRVARELAIPILVTEQYPKGLGPTSPGIAEALQEFEAVAKTSFSCAADPALRQRIERSGRHEIIVCGIEAHICVYQTSRDLVRMGLGVDVAGDAITSRGEYDLSVARERMRAEGAVVSSTEMIIYDLLGRSGTEEFRRLLPLLKE